MEDDTPHISLLVHLWISVEESLEEVNVLVTIVVVVDVEELLTLHLYNLAR